jgi:arginine deiminase
VTTGVGSEVGELQVVLVHRPGLELHRLTPSNMEDLLFDELLWVERAQEEHDVFTSVLRDAGAEVLYLHELLSEVLVEEEVAREVVTAHATERTCGPELVGRVRDFLLGLDVGELVRHLVGGVALGEIGGGDGLLARAHRPHEPVLPPLPNTVFTRDSSAWIGDGVVVAPMNRLVRRREADLLRLVYTRHPRFAGARIWFGGEPVEHYPASLEGGDVVVVASDGLALGISERTSPQAIETLAGRLFAAGVVSRIVAVELPRARTTMHLDTVVSMVDRDAFLLYPRIRPLVRCHRVMPAAGKGIHVEDGSGLRADLAWAAGLDEARTIEPALDSVAADREQWNDANNVFAIRPGEVVAYERNVATNATLEEAGVTVRLIPSQELPRGRGGPRCMTCPVARAPV